MAMSDLIITTTTIHSIHQAMSRIGLHSLSVLRSRALPALRSNIPARVSRNARSPFQYRQSTSSSSSSSNNAQRETLRAQIMNPTTIVLIMVPIFTFGLGCWQIQRLRWKVGLIEEVERNMKREPMVLPAHIK